MTDFSIDQTPNTPQGPQATGDSQQPVQQKGTNPKDIKIFDFGGDNNHNAIVDADDFDNPETLKMYQDKGLIGKPWVMIKEKLGELFNLKNSTAKFSESIHEDVPIDVFVTYDEKGRITRRERIQTEEDSGLFCPDDDSFSNSSQKQLVTTYDNYKYDEKGNPISYNENNKNIDDGTLIREYNEKVCIDNQYNSNGQLIKTTEKHPVYGVDHVYTNEYNTNGDLIKQSEGYFGKAPSSFTTYEYDKNGKVVKRNGKDITEN